MPNWQTCAKSMEIFPVCIHAASVVLDNDSSNTSPPTARQIRRAMTDVFEQRRTNMKTANRAGAEGICERILELRARHTPWNFRRIDSNHSIASDFLAAC